MERLQRVMAARGSGSRRSAEALIVAGRVQVDGKVVTELGTRVDPATAEIRVDGKILRPQRPRVIMLNKPTGFITTVNDERERRTVMELVNIPERIYPVGRLDRDTEGLLLFTNDGDIANRVMHPRYKLAKEYQVLTRARPSDSALQRVRDGFEIDGQKVVPAEFRILRQTREGLVLKIVVHQGLYHVVRRLMQNVGIPVDGLRRVRIGPVSIEGVAVGAWRDLTPGELTQLLQAVHLDEESDSEVGVYPSWRQSRNRSRIRPSLARRQSSDVMEQDASPRTPPVRPAAHARTPQRRASAPTSTRERGESPPPSGIAGQDRLPVGDVWLVGDRLPSGQPGDRHRADRSDGNRGDQSRRRGDRSGKRPEEPTEKGGRHTGRGQGHSGSDPGEHAPGRGRRQQHDNAGDTPRRSATDLERMGQRRGRSRKPTESGRNARGEQRPHDGERQDGGHGRGHGKFSGTKGRPARTARPERPRRAADDERRGQDTGTGGPAGSPPRDRHRRGRGGRQDHGGARTRRPPEGDAV